MLRFIFVISISIPFILYYIPKAVYYVHHPERYNEEDRYCLALKIIGRLKKNARIQTIVDGQNNLPKEGGYIMFSNHQGKYDTLGIMYGHKEPCAVVMDEKRSHLFIASQFLDLVGGARLDKTDMRKQIKTIEKVAQEVKNGRRYILFPEGGYDHNGNTLQEFLPGAFKCAQKARCPIVPVAIYDSYKPFAENSLRKVRTGVYFLKPIPYEEYKGMNTKEIAGMVKERIREKMNSISFSCGN